MPAWASWEWPKSTKGKMGKFECHFFCLVTGIHPAFSVNGKCRRLECRGYSRGSIFEHHFFECENSKKNRIYFKAKVHSLFEISKVGDLSLTILDRILSKPSQWWIGLIDSQIFDLCSKITHVHEFHRIFTTASILSWGRFYVCPIKLEQ